MEYAFRNRLQKDQTASPYKYPNKRFKDKPCKNCGSLFSPTSPCNLYCSQECADDGLTSAYLQRTYDITIEDYRVMYKEQSGTCKICNSEGFLMNPKRHKCKLVVDHCHTTGKVRGLLCHNCNRALGLLKDSINTLANAIKYVEGATTIRKE